MNFIPFVRDWLKQKATKRSIIVNWEENFGKKHKQ